MRLVLSALIIRSSVVLPADDRASMRIQARRYASSTDAGRFARAYDGEPVEAARAAHAALWESFTGVIPVLHHAPRVPVSNASTNHVPAGGARPVAGSLGGDAFPAASRATTVYWPATSGGALVSVADVVPPPADLTSVPSR